MKYDVFKQKTDFFKEWSVSSLSYMLLYWVILSMSNKDIKKELMH